MDTPPVVWIFLSVIGYWAYCIYWGIRGSISSRTVEDYFLAGRQLPPWVFVCAATATCFSGWAFLGLPGLVYRDGFQFGYVLLAPVALAVTGVLFLKRQWMLGRRYRFITAGEMFAYYFRSDLIRLLVVLVALVYAIPYIGIQLRAAGFLFDVLTHGALGADISMWMLATVLMSYVASGGLRTVAYVDILQFILLTLGLVIVGGITFYFLGDWERLSAGIAALTEIDPIRTPDGYSHYVAIPGVIQFVSDGSQAQGGAWTGVMILTYMFGIMGIMATPAFSTWAFAARSSAAFAPQQVWASAFGIGLIFVVFVMIQGIGGHFLGADHLFMISHFELVNPVMVDGLRSMDLMATVGQQDMLVPQLIRLVGGTAPYVLGLLALCALAAMESTAAGYMATASGIVTRDVIGRFVFPHADDRTQKFIGRLCVVAVVFLALIVATTATDALSLLGGLAVSYGVQMWPALIALCYWPFLTRMGVALGMIAGLVAVTLTEPIGQQWFGITAWGRWPWTIHSAGWGIVANLTIAILVSLVTKDDRARKQEVHDFLDAHAAVPNGKRRLIPVAWLLTLAWFCFALGPGAVVGNWVFGSPDDPQSWWFGIPSIWTWQFISWGLGVLVLWFLAYFLEMSTAPPRPIQSIERNAPPSDETSNQPPSA